MGFSFFFRDLPILETAVDEFMKATAGRSRIHVWVAGCAMGQEVYTLAMLMAEKMGHFAFQNVSIKATDLEASFQPIVEKAVYPAEILARIPDSYREKYFEPADEPGHERVVEKVRQRVTFTHHDILSLRPITEALSLIVCKNVLLHFQPQERIEVFRMFHRALGPGGVMANENTQKLPAEIKPLFEQVSGDVNVYRKVGRNG